MFPCEGRWHEAGVVAEAARFTARIRRPTGIGGSYASADDDDLVLDTVARVDHSAALLLRLYEGRGARGTARVRLAPFGRARLVNALEDELGEARLEDGALVFDYLPHQVLTVLLD